MPCVLWTRLQMGIVYVHLVAQQWVTPPGLLSLLPGRFWHLTEQLSQVLHLQNSPARGYQALERLDLLFDIICMIIYCCMSYFSRDQCRSVPLFFKPLCLSTRVFREIMLGVLWKIIQLHLSGKNEDNIPKVSRLSPLNSRYELCAHRKQPRFHP